MAKSATSTNGDPVIDPTATSGTDRDRSRAELEVVRAPSESRATAILVGFIVSSHFWWFARLSGDGRLMLASGAVAFGFLVALVAHAEPEPDRGPKGVIARMPEPAFERLMESVEREAALLASGTTAASAGSEEALDSDGFALLVGKALDDLPRFMRLELERNVAVVIADDGDSHGAYGYYGLYMGGTAADSGYGHLIVIFRDTLMRDYGGDPDTLRRQVVMTVRHELAHHLGAGERHVAELGLSDHARLRLRTNAVPARPGVADEPLERVWRPSTGRRVRVMARIPLRRDALPAHAPPALQRAEPTTRSVARPRGPPTSSAVSSCERMPRTTRHACPAGPGRREGSLIPA